MNILKCVWSIFALLCFANKLHAQSNPAINASVTSGCSPLSITFSNSSAGFSDKAVYEWDFGNNNKVITSNKDSSVGAIYNLASIYTVTLTVTDSNKVSSTSLNINVFKNPTASFTINKYGGCTPLSVKFTSTSIAGSGKINFYLWDFGNGNVQQGDSLADVLNLYNNGGNYPVKLLVRNSNNCSSIQIINDSIIRALQSPKSNYVRSNNFLCSIGDSSTFTNKSNNIDNATYSWRFGDGKSSTTSNPVHPYFLNGTFQDSLIVTNKNGCADTSFSASPVYVASFVTNYKIPDSACANSNVTLTNVSIPTPTSYYWESSEMNITPLKSPSFNHTYANEGAFTIKLINKFGSCIDSVSKKLKVVASTVLSNFVVNNIPLCNGKVSIVLIDTVVGDRNWVWKLNDTIIQKTQQGKFQLSIDSIYKFSLSTITASGCAAEVSLLDSVKKVPVKITTDPIKITGCPGLQLRFSTNPPIGLSNYNWDFGDTTYSSQATPTHTYNNVGTYPVSLAYTTADGCRDTVWLRSVKTALKPKAAFSISTNSPTVCGNTKIYFTDQTMPKPINEWSWNFGDSTPINHTSNPNHSYHDTGTFNMQLIVSNGICADTLFLPKYFTILPSIAYIDTIKNTCNDKRDTVTFTQKNKLVKSGTWYFGDGDSLSLDTSIRVYKHIYKNEGAFIPILKSTDGNCIVSDSEKVYVLFKQHPYFVADTNKLVADTNVFCEQDWMTLRLKPKSVDTNMAVVNNNSYYALQRWQYGDGSFYTGIPTSSRNFTTTYKETLTPLAPGKLNIRAITISNFFGCSDTSNYVIVKTKGPIAGYQITNASDCFKKPITFHDTSKVMYGVPIVKWTWGFGDSTSTTVSAKYDQSHVYAKPASYPTYLKVTDKEGCIDSTRYNNAAAPTGPIASFNWLPTDIVTDSATAFTSTSNIFGCINPKYNWSLSNSKFKDSTASISYTYSFPLKDTITLIVTNPSNHCIDTAINSVIVKRAIAKFSTTISYSDKQTSCPPAVVTAQSKSIGATQISWDFGDSTSGTGLITNSVVQHTYAKPGVYTLKLVVYNNSFRSDSSTETLKIEGPYANIKSNIQKSCGPTSVALSAKGAYENISWYFGDVKNTLPNKKDSILTHLYSQAGTFFPSILLEDTHGCKSSFTLSDSIIIDTLKASFTLNNHVFCNEAAIVCTANISSYSGDNLKKPLSYRWSFDSTNNINATSTLLSPNFLYTKPGKYPITQKVTTFGGCKTIKIDTVQVNASAKPVMTSPTNVCENEPVDLTATAANAAKVKWNWLINNKDSSSLQKLDTMHFKTVKDSSYNVQAKVLTLINGCADSAIANFMVHPIPYFKLTVTPAKKPICQNETITLSASDGKSYLWSPDNTNNHNASLTLIARETALYSVTATNQFKCSSSDTTTVTVVPKQIPNFNPVRLLCNGDSVELNVNGADSLVWSTDSSTLSNFGDHPFAKPTTTTDYEFKASDKYKCFTFYGNINVEVGNTPTPKSNYINVLTGDVAALNTVSSPAYTSYKWTPNTYLSCDGCAVPDCTPRSDIGYGVLVKTKYGCQTTDSVFVHITCADAVYVPSAFAPNGLNKLLYPAGKGVKKINYFRVFNRDGQLIYERSNFLLGDSSIGWNGKMKGKEIESGTYVYTLEAICDTGEVFHKKGTVVLIR